MMPWEASTATSGAGTSSSVNVSGTAGAMYVGADSCSGATAGVDDREDREVEFELRRRLPSRESFRLREFELERLFWSC